LNHFLHRYGTPLTAGLFVVSAVSGIALFFHWAPRSFHAMHEWLSMLLLAPLALHLWKNWKPLVAYATRRTLYIPLALSVVAAVPFAVLAAKGGGRAGSPASRTVTLMTETSLIDLAPVFRSTPEALLRHLQQRGYKASSTGQSPSTIGTASAAPASEILFSMMPERRSVPEAGAAAP
jgi:hypothetical protein